MELKSGAIVDIDLLGGVIGVDVLGVVGCVFRTPAPGSVSAVFFTYDGVVTSSVTVSVVEVRLTVSRRIRRGALALSQVVCILA